MHNCIVVNIFLKRETSLIGGKRELDFSASEKFNFGGNRKMYNMNM